MTFTALDGGVFQSVKFGFAEPRADLVYRNFALCLRLARQYRDSARNHDWFSPKAAELRKELLAAMWTARNQRTQ